MTPSIYIIDAYSLLMMPSICKPQHQLGPLLQTMTDMVKNKQLTFPNLVVRDCKKFGAAEFPTMWADAASGHRDRSHHSSIHEYQEKVLANCYDILDPDDPEETAQLDVLALALQLSPTEVNNGRPRIVTDDIHDVPERMCLHKAAAQMSVQSMTLSDFLHAIGGQAYLS